jgi:hypothetical protein
MTRFAEAPALIASMGRKSRQIAERKYDVYEVNNVILKTIGLAA